MTRAGLLAERGFQLVPFPPGTGTLAAVFTCGPDRDDGGHDHFQVEPFREGTRPRWRG